MNDYMPNVPAPTPDESFERYSIRAQRQLFREIPDPFERLKLVRHTWRAHRGPTAEEQLADRVFSPERYRKVEDVCVFSEHQTTDSQGQPRNYDLRKLAKIVRYCNDRAREHQAFAAIADRHTSDPKEPNPADPKVLGYAGPYRLGLIGDRKPTWAIFTDEYRNPSEDYTFGQKNRRSVELWTDKASGRMWFDPITTCGADAPRLPLPSRYSQINVAGMDCERYTADSTPAVSRYNAGMAVSPGGANTSIQKPTGLVTRYDATQGPTAQPLPGGTPMDQCAGQGLTIDQIVEAVMALPPVQWAMQKMAEPEPGPAGMDQLTPSASTAPPPGPPPGAAATPAPGGPPGAPGAGEPDGDEGLGDLDDLLGDDEPETPGAGPGPADDDPDLDKEKNSMAAYTAQEFDKLVKDNYSLRKSQDALVREFALANDQLKSLKRESSDAKRVARFSQFRAAHPAFPVDDEELKPALYSLGGSMTDEQFEQHIATLEKFAAKWVQPVALPQGEVAPPPTDKEQYAMRLKDRTVQLYTMTMDSDEPLNWEQAREKAIQELKG